MDNILHKAFRLLNLDPNEIKFFEVSYQIGPATVNEVAKKANIQRSTAYLIAKRLIEKGFLEEDLKSYKKKVYAIDPSKILQMISAKQRALRKQEIELEESLPILQAQYQSSDIRPKVRAFEGNSGLIKVWQDILSTKGEILLWTNQQTENDIFGDNAHSAFIKDRVKKGLKIRVLAVDNIQAQELIKNDTQVLRETRILPKETNFSAETYIYDNKVAILDYNKDLMGVIMESAPIASAQKAIFETVWNQLI